MSITRIKIFSNTSSSAQYKSLRFEGARWYGASWYTYDKRGALNSSGYKDLPIERLRFRTFSNSTGALGTVKFDAGCRVLVYGYEGL